MNFQIKSQIYLFYFSLFKDFKTSGLFSYLYKLPLPSSLRLPYWKKILNVTYDATELYKFVLIDNTVYSNKNIMNI